MPFLVLLQRLGQEGNYLEEFELLSLKDFPFLKRVDSVKLQDREIGQLVKVLKQV